MHDDPSHAIGLAYVRQPLQNGFSIAGDFALPRVPDNKGWYAQWYTYTAPPASGVRDQPFLQTGIVRSSEANAKLQAFVAVRPKGGAATVRALGSLPDTTHHLTLTLRNRVLTFAVDGKTYYSEKSNDFFAPGATGPYLQIGHELSHPGDTAKGAVSHIAFTGRAGSNAPFARDLSCYYFSNGVTLDVTRDEGLSSGGSFDSDSADVEHCVK